MTIARAFETWLTPEAPRERALIVRTLVAGFATVYLLVRFRYFGDMARHAPSDFAPVGVCSVLAAPMPAVAPWAILSLTIALGVAFTLGRRARFVGPLFFVGLLWTVSYASSWGKILHSENLFVLHVLVFAIAGELKDARTAGWALRAGSVVTVLTYLVAGATKLRSGGGAWLSGQALGDWLAWDALRKIELGSFHSPLAERVAKSPVLLQAFAIFTFVVELGAPAALVSRRVARLWVLLAWSFHAGVLATMAIGFFYPLSGFAFAPLLEMERWPVLRGRLRRWLVRT